MISESHLVATKLQHGMGEFRIAMVRVAVHGLQYDTVLSDCRCLIYYGPGLHCSFWKAYGSIDSSHHVGLGKSPSWL